MHGLYAFSERKQALDRLRLVTATFKANGFYEPEEQAAEHLGTADLQRQVPATESGYGLKHQAKEAADGAEIEPEPQSPSTAMRDDDGHVPFVDLLD